MNRQEYLKQHIADFPTSSGVYLMKNKTEKIIYVGKAKNLKSRVRSYFQESKDISPKTKLLVTHIYNIEYMVTQNEVEAFLLEASLIKKHKPRYNIRLKDDKAYPYIRFSMKDKFPRVYLSRRVKRDGSQYFGPYTSGRSVWQTINFLNQTFLIRDCSDHFMRNRDRPCLTHQIGRCGAPCVGLIDKETYRENIKDAMAFLKGKNKKVLRSLRESMEAAADVENFERAAKLRDAVLAIEHILEKQTVINDKSEIDQDAIQFYGDERGVTVEVLVARAGRVLGSRAHFLPQVDPAVENPKEWLVSFINQYYEDNLIPDEILVPPEIENEMSRLLQKVLESRAQKDVSVLYVHNEKREELVKMSLENAKQHFKEHVSGSEKKMSALEEIQKKLHLPSLPRRIECYDISHFQGAETVASQVVFEDGVPNTDQYRRYKLKTISGVNDYDSMKEVLTRRLSHDEYDEPQLILIDGGKGQLNVVTTVLKDLKREDLPLASLAKARTESDFEKEQVESSQERFFLPGRVNPVTFRSNSEALKILTAIRDEAHRFAITYHRKLREGTSLESALDSIAGLGPKRKQLLLAHFESVDAIRNASIAEISSLEGFNQDLAEKILTHLKK